MSASISSVRSLMIIPRSRDRAVFTLTGGSIADISDGSYEALDRDAFFFSPLIDRCCAERTLDQGQRQPKDLGMERESERK